MKLRILVVSYLFPNKIYPNFGIFVFNRLKALLPYCDIKVINPIPWFPFCSRLERYRNFHRIPSREVMEGIEVFHPRFFIVPRFFKLLDALTFSFAVIPLSLRLKKVFPCDLIDLHWTYPDLPGGLLLSRLMGKKLLVTIRGMEAFYVKDGMFRKIAVQWLLRRCSSIITLSKSLRQHCISRGISPEKVTVITNGVDTDRFHYIPRDECRRRLGLDFSGSILLAVGSLTQVKGFDRLIKTVPMVLARYPETRLCIVGSIGPAGNYGKELLRLTKSLGLERYVSFIGEISNESLVFWYNAADLFCLTSRSEGSPNVLSEALACGCPAVTTDVGAASDILNREEMGFVVSNSEEGILSGIQRAFLKNFDRSRISSCLERFDWNWCALNVVAAYRRVLAKNELE